MDLSDKILINKALEKSKRTNEEQYVKIVTGLFGSLCHLDNDIMRAIRSILIYYTTDGTSIEYEVNYLLNNRKDLYAE